MRCKDPEKELFHRKRLSNALTGRKFSQETLLKIGTKSKGRIVTAETREKISRALKDHSPLKGVPLPPEHCRKLSESHKGISMPQFSEEHCKKLSLSKIGDKNPMRRHEVIERHPGFKGGISYLPYCRKFNKEFKERVRAFFGYRCAVCGRPAGLEKHNLAVHHVSYDKEVCCNDEKPLFVALCNSCHAKTTNGDRLEWELWFREFLALTYGNKCYFARGE